MSFHGSQTGLNRRLSDRRFPPGDFTARSDGQVEGFPPLHQQYAGVGGSHLAGTQMYGTVGGRSETQHTITKQRSLYSPRNSRTYDLIEQSQNVSVMDLLKTRHNISLELTENCALKLSEAEKMLQQDLNAFDRGHLGRYRHQIDALLRGAGDDLANIEDNIVDLHRNRYPTEALQTSVFRLRSQMRIIAKTISDRWTERSKSMYNINQRYTDSWDEELSRSTSELFSWLKQQKLLLDSQEWGVDATSVEQHMNNHKRYHKSLEEARRKIDKIKAEQYDNHSSNYRDAIEAIESEYESMLKASEDRFDQLRKFQDIIQATSNEIMWINDREEEELVYDWSDKNTNMAQKQEMFSILMSQLEEKEKRLNRLKQEGDQLVANNHPASDKIEAYIDTLQTQWSWILQLTKCIEVHLKENSNYFQFFEDAQVTENSLKKMQDSLRKKYVCDRSTSLQQLEKMITESEKDKEKIHEYKRQVSNLVNKSKKIVQLKPRNPSTAIDQRGPNQIILKALCDYKQDQRVVHRGNECILLDNSQRSKWRVIGPGGMEMEVPSICLLIPPPNPGAIDLANKIDQYYEAILSLWNQLYINMKSLISWQYCMIDIEKIQSWTISVLRTMSREDYELVLKNLEKNFKAFQAYSKDSQYFSDADKHKLENEFGSSKKRYVNMVTTLEEERTSVQGPTQVVIPPQVLPRVDMNFQQELQKIRHRLEVNENKMMEKIHLLIDSNAQEEFAQRTSELESLQDQLNTIDDDFISLQSRWYQSPNASCNQKTYFETEFSRISQRLKNSSDFSSAYLERMKALRLLFQNILEVEDLIKVYEARLTEEETVPMSLEKIESYRDNLQKMKMELDQKKNLLTSMQQSMQESLRINDDIMPSFYKCDIDLAKYNEKVTQLTDRWQRIYKEIDSRYYDLDKERKQLRDYGDLFQKLSKWIDVTKRKQDGLQINRYEDTNVLVQQLSEQKNLYSEIKNKRGDVEEYQKHADRCATSVKDYELQLASYSAGLETLLSIPVKRQVAQSISTTILHESADLQSRYIELLTRSGDYYKYLSEMLKSMEEAKATDMIKQTQSAHKDIIQEKESLLLKIKLLEQDKARLQRYEDELSRVKALLEAESRMKQRLQDEIDIVRTDVSYWKSQAEVQQLEKGKSSSEFERLKAELDRLQTELRMTEERYRRKLEESERAKRMELEALQAKTKLEIEKLSQTPPTFNKQTQTGDMVLVESAKLLFDGIRKKVTANQLYDCQLIDKSTLDKLLRGEKTVMDVSNDINLNLCGLENIAGVYSQSNGEKLSMSEATKKNILTPDVALSLLEAQAATGFIIDPHTNKRMTVDEAVATGLVDHKDRDKLLVAEKAATGFKDPFTGKVISLYEAIRKNIVDKETGLRLLGAQIAASGIIDPINSVYLPKELAYKRGLIDAEMYQKLTSPFNESKIFVDPNTNSKVSYQQLKLNCRTDPGTDLLLLPVQKSEITLPGIRTPVPIHNLVDAEIIDQTTIDGLNCGLLTIDDVAARCKGYLQGDSSIAGVFVEATREKLPIYQAMKKGLIRQGTAFELLEAQAATGHIIDPINNQRLTVEEAAARKLIGVEFKTKLLSAEKAVTGYKDPETEKTISLFQAMKKGLIEHNHGIRLLEAQIATGGIIDPMNSHRLPVDIAYKRNYFDEELNEILVDPSDDTKGFFDPNTEENLTYLQLKDRCITDKVTGLCLLPLREKKKEPTTSRSSAVRKRRVVIVDPETEREMTVREAYHKDLIDYETFLELSEQEAEWEEITIKGSDGSTKTVVVDRKTGNQYDIEESLQKGIIDKKSFEDYRAGTLTLSQFVDLFADKVNLSVSRVSTVMNSSPVPSPSLKNTFDSLEEPTPIAAIFDVETLEKITISEAMRRNIVDTITGQRLLEAQACTGGIINPGTGQKLSIQDAIYQCIIDEEMGKRLKPAQKAYVGFDDVKNKKRLSAAEAMQESWLPYEAGQRFLEYQSATGGLVVPNITGRITIDEAVRRGLINAKTAQKLQDSSSYSKCITCPKTKLKISYKEAVDRSMVEDKTGLRMLEATSFSTKGINSPYNAGGFSGPNSRPGSRSGSRPGSRPSSRSGSRRGSFDAGSSTLTSSTQITIKSSSITR
ncbi:desmoplakin-like isoform X2 [Pristis pectinata]|uniref:desmoplakin-like isoform X2 n=1 Tax=Pristis pectinata TaxID=685728 RepID=UPI00223E364A|nr:desmoplakin-like isoform X2 [Pristis pectinata]